MGKHPKVTVIADSITASGHRLTTLEVHNAQTAVLTGDIFTTIQHIAVTPETFREADLDTAEAAITAARAQSTPTLVGTGELHLPYLTARERAHLSPSQHACISAARCVRATDRSTHGRRNIDAEIALYQALISGDPPRMGPIEHVALPAGYVAVPDFIPDGRFAGWVSLRDLFDQRGVEYP